MSDSIYALASGRGAAGIAVIRVSGPAAGPALIALAGTRPTPRRATLARLRSPGGGGALDTGLVLWFPAPASATGDDVAEFHVHGGRAVIDGVLLALAARPDLRLAEPGEFTRRAFENDKLDLTAAEGVADLVAAQTESQRHQALRQLDGELGRLYESWRSRLLHALAHAEAYIDFPDEDLTGTGPPQDLRGLSDEIRRHLNDRHRGERLRDGLQVAIVGAPNVGKSSLMNRLARRDVAIVSATAGTTRDVIEVQLDLGGYPVVIADTAGLREASGDVEGEGVRRALARAGAADLRLAVFDAALWPETDPATTALVDADTLVVLNKCDLTTPPPEPRLNGAHATALSAQTGAGMDTLLSALSREAATRLELVDVPSLTRTRHREALTDCLAALDRCGAATLPELAVEDLRLAVRAVGRITGRVDVEDLLDMIFRDFCIGK